MTILPEHAILKYILNKDIYNKYYNYISLEYIKKNYKEIFNVFQCISEFHQLYEGDASFQDIQALCFQKYPEQREVYESVLSTAAASEATEANLLSIFQESERRAKLAQIALAAFEASEGRKDAGEVEALFSSLVESQASPEIEESRFVSDDLKTLYDSVVKTKGLRWRLGSLNQALGSLRKGDMGFVFARPETGKTTFLASETTFMAEQAENPVLWLNNEEQGDKVMLRCFQAALGLTLEQLLSDVNKHQKAFNKLIDGRLRILNQGSFSRNDVERLCKQLSPSLIIFDQIDKTTGFQSDREDLKLGAIYQWSRELAKAYAPVIGVCQADGTGEGVKWLTMAHVANAKTSKQAEADWILGIGRSHEAGYENVRHFNVSKNKLFGDEDTIAEMRHGHWDVLINPSIARYEDILR